MTPVTYKPEFEIREEAEAETAHALMETMKKISETTFHDDPSRALRSVHAKNHGIMNGKFQVLSGLPPEFAQGLFAMPGEYDIVMRLSTPPGDILSDEVSLSRGLGIKIKGVPGDKTLGTDGDVQNLVMVNGPVFMTKTAKEFLANLKLLAGTTNKMPEMKKILSTGLQAVEKAIETVTGAKSPKILGMGGHPETHILGETFFSEVPYLYGPYMAKFSIAPAAQSLKALKDLELDMDDKPDALKQAVRDYFNHNDAEWEFRVQLCADVEKMPIEDPSVEWKEDISPYIAVARIVVPKGGLLSEEQAKLEEDQISFNPWHGLAAHRPLGSINRARRPAYEMSAKFRAQRNECPMHAKGA